MGSKADMRRLPGLVRSTLESGHSKSIITRTNAKILSGETAYPSRLTGAGDRGRPERRRFFARSESHRPASPTVGFVIGGLVFSIQFHTPRGGIESTDGYPTAAPAMESGLPSQNDQRAPWSLPFRNLVMTSI